MPRYILLAGVNGSGKSTYYRMTDDRTREGYIYINADNIERELGGNWHSSKDNFTAMREAIKRLNVAFDNRLNIIQETTLASSKNGIQKLINKAKTRGYEVKLVYVGISSPELAIARIARRVEKGGHGVSTEIVYQRYNRSLDRLTQLEGEFDYVELWDNSGLTSNIIYIRDRNKTLLNITKEVNWVPDKFKE